MHYTLVQPMVLFYQVFSGRILKSQPNLEFHTPFVWSFFRKNWSRLPYQGVEPVHNLNICYCWPKFFLSELHIASRHRIARIFDTNKLLWRINKRIAGSRRMPMKIHPRSGFYPFQAMNHRTWYGIQDYQLKTSFCLLQQSFCSSFRGFEIQISRPMIVNRSAGRSRYAPPIHSHLPKTRTWKFLLAALNKTDELCGVWWFIDVRW